MDYIQQHIVQIDLLSREIEMAQLNQGIYEMLKQGNEALKTLNQVLNFLKKKAVSTVFWATIFTNSKF